MSPVPSLLTTTSGSLIAARKRVLSQYRDWMRAAPSIVHMYHLEIPTDHIKQKIRSEFEKNRYVNDLNIIDILLFKGRTEYEETLNYWKQKSHVMRYFENDLHAEPVKHDFLSKFYQGTA